MGGLRILPVVIPFLQVPGAADPIAAQPCERRLRFRHEVPVHAQFARRRDGVRQAFPYDRQVGCAAIDQRAQPAVAERQGLLEAGRRTVIVKRQGRGSAGRRQQQREEKKKAGTYLSYGRAFCQI